MNMNMNVNANNSQNHIKCNCCSCTDHSSCPTIVNPRWVNLLPEKINELIWGPVEILPPHCIYEIKEVIGSEFKIVNRYVYPNYITKMITLPLLTKSTQLLHPGQPLAALCIVHINDAINDICGKQKYNTFLII